MDNPERVDSLLQMCAVARKISYNVKGLIHVIRKKNGKALKKSLDQRCNFF